MTGECFADFTLEPAAIGYQLKEPLDIVFTQPNVRGSAGDGR
jgi:hypothetical protein